MKYKTKGTSIKGKNPFTNIVETLNREYTYIPSDRVLLVEISDEDPSGYYFIIYDIPMIDEAKKIIERLENITDIELIIKDITSYPKYEYSYF